MNLLGKPDYPIQSTDSGSPEAKFIFRLPDDDYDWTAEIHAARSRISHGDFAHGQRDLFHAHKSEGLGSFATGMRGR